MHIKQITISNFRSYRQQPEIHPFSPGTNAVVGRNGSGKSNLFDAVQFVLLAPKFWTLRAEDRQDLLHEGSGSAAVNAFVEIVFDNSDNRFSLENSDEVVLRRTVGHKKDEFFLQRKRASKHEVMSLLEGAGFSKSNPYFIVQQGKVNALCVMTDEHRLQLLKEVAGTTVYDEKKEESLVKMAENTTNLEKIQESLAFMEERLEELRGEKEELTQYQELDRKRRSMAFTLYDKELRRARETLDEIEHLRADDVEKRGEIFELVRSTADAITNVEGTQKSKTTALRRNMVLMAGLEKDKRSAMTLRTKLNLQLDELQESIQQNEITLKTNAEELKSLNKEIQKARDTLSNTIQPKYDDARDSLRRMTSERDEAQKKMEGLYAKQGRGSHFNTMEERDVYLTTQIQELEGLKLEKEAFRTEQQDTLANLRRTHQSLTQQVEKKKNDIGKKTKTLDKLNDAIQEKKKQRNDMAEQRKDQWGELDDLSNRLSEARENQQRAYSNLRKIMPRNTAMGLDALQRIVEEEGLRRGVQYFGPLMDNVELVDPKFQTAVEVAAQNALFHVIVDTDATAARLMQRLERDRLGRVTFLPLNQLHSPNVTYPDSSDVTPILRRCIRYEGRLQKAMEHVFGKKLLARSVDVASTWSAQCNMDAITLDGDLCSRKGALTGGWVDHSKSRLRANNELHSAQETLEKLTTEERDMKQKHASVVQRVTTLMTEMQRLEAKKASLDHVLTQMEEEVTTSTSRLQSKEKQMQKIETDVIPPIDVEVKSLTNQIGLLHGEMGTELSETLSEDEKNLLRQLKSIQTELERDMESQTQTLEEVGVERQRLHSLLDDNLLKRKKELEESGADISSNRRRSNKGVQPVSQLVQEERIEELERVKLELEESVDAVEEIERKLESAKNIDDELRGALIAAKRELEELRSRDLENKKELEDAQKRDEKLMNKRSLCVSQRELHMRRIQELGSLPPTSELEKYKTHSISTLMKALESVGKELKEYVHVNKKAYDQFVNFSEQRESLLKRKEEVDQGAEKVKELVESLDRQKDEAINRTFRGVSAHFKDVFTELVPNGAGELIMQTTLDDNVADSESDGASDSEEETKKSSKNPSVHTYRGVGVKVRFSAVGENYMMSQLSGGQKSLVALALIFAIQRCDPAPFYLFDELDQALDSTYRAAVAAVIQKQANNEDQSTQFVCSTFRPELVAVANQCYGISHQDKVSNIHLLSKKDALKFIANLMNEEEAVGEVTSLATSRASMLSKKRKAEVDDEEDEAESVEEMVE